MGIITCLQGSRALLMIGIGTGFLTEVLFLNSAFIAFQSISFIFHLFEQSILSSSVIHHSIIRQVTLWTLWEIDIVGIVTA